jgi:hypothetical protein
MILIQRIRSKWDKKARGGPAAVSRSAIPEAVKIPVHQYRNSAFVYQDRFYGSSLNGFREEICVGAENPLILGCVTLNIGSGDLEAIFRYDAGCGGAPYRWSEPKTFRLQDGQWVQIAYNGRFSWNDYWWYEKTVINAGVFQMPKSGIFLNNEPTHRFSSLALLR